MKSIIESFGGKVTGSVSGKTDILIAGKAPGGSKVGQAESKGIPIMSISDLKLGLESGVDVDNINVTLNLENVEFSKGYRGNAVLRVTGGTTSSLQINDGKRKSDTKKPKSNKKFKAEMDENSEVNLDDSTIFEYS